MSHEITARYRWLVASRVIGAAIGGYALVSAASVLMALVLPLPQAQAVLASMMISFILYVVVVIWAFSTRSVARVWWGILSMTAVLALLSWWLLPGAAA